MPVCPRPAYDRRGGDHKAFLAIEPEQAFVVHREALPSQQDVQAPVTEAPPHMGQTSQPARSSASSADGTISTVTVRSRSFCTPAASTCPTQNEGERQPLAWQRASPFFCQQVLECGVIEHGVCQELL